MAAGDRGVRLSALLILPLVLVAGFSLVTLLWLSARGSDKAVQQQAARWMDGHAALAQDRLGGFLNRTVEPLYEFGALAREGGFSPGETAGVKAFLRRKVQSYAEISVLGFGGAAGDYLAYAADPAGGALATADGAGVVEMVHAAAFDARLEPWFEAAVKAGGPAWSGVYAWNSGGRAAGFAHRARLQPPVRGVSAAAPVYGPDGDFYGVAHHAVRLAQLQRQLEPIRHRGAHALLLDRDGGLLVATHDRQVGADGGASSLPELSEDPASAPVLRAAAAFLSGYYLRFEGFPEQRLHSLQLDGEDFFLQVVALADDRGLDWRLILLAERARFDLQAQRARREMAGFAAAALIIMLALGLLLVRWITRPAAYLTQAIEEIGQGLWKGRLKRTGIREIDSQLAATEALSRSIQGAFVHLDGALQAQNLQWLNARRSVALLRHLVPGLLCRFRHDLERTPEWIGKGCHELTGYRSEALRNGRDLAFMELVHPDDRAPLQLGIREATARYRSFDLSYRLITGYGEERWVRERGMAVRDEAGKVAFIESLILDQEPLEQARRTERAARQGVARNRMQRRRMLAVIPNALGALLPARQPLRPGADATAMPATPAPAEVLTCWKQQLETLAALEAGRWSSAPRPVRVAELAAAAAEGFRAGLEGRGVALVMTADAALRGPLITDPAVLEQILDALLRNAAAATEQGRVALTLRARGGRSGEALDLVIRVTDTGCGVPLEEQAALFEPFVRGAAAEDANPAGLGLGLPLVQGLARALWGRASLESAVGEGTTVEVLLPELIPAPESEPRAQPGPRRMVERRLSGRVLVADDEELNRLVLTASMQGLAVEILEAADGEEALAMIREYPPDLVLLDIHMPKLDGDQLAAALRRDPRLAKVPLVAVSAAANPEEEERLARVFDGFLAKPVVREALLRCLDRFLSSPGGE